MTETAGARSDGQLCEGSEMTDARDGRALPPVVTMLQPLPSPPIHCPTPSVDEVGPSIDHLWQAGGRERGKPPTHARRRLTGACLLNPIRFAPPAGVASGVQRLQLAMREGLN